MFNIQFLKKGRKYINDSLLTGLISYWKLNEASGTRADSVGSNNLTDNNTVTRVLGKQSGAAQFVLANTEYLSVASNSSLQVGNEPFCICGWVYLSTNATTQSLFSKYNTSSNRQFLVDYVTGTNRFRFVVSPDGSATVTQVYANNFGAPSTGTWYFICAWHDSVGDTVNIQVNNGTADSAAFVGGVFPTGNGDFTIGSNSGGGSYLNGYADEIGFWKRLLTTEEKTRLYNSGNGITYPFNSILDRIVSYWTLDETAGNAADSCDANTLSAEGSATFGPGKIENGSVLTRVNDTDDFAIANSSQIGLGPLGGFSVQAWVNFASLPASGFTYGIISKWSSSGNFSFDLPFKNVAGTYRFQVNSTTDGSSVTTGNFDYTPSTDTWYHLVWSYDATGGTCILYINGVAQVQATSLSTSIYNGTASFRVGNTGQLDVNRYFDGRIDEVGFWLRTLSAAEAAYLYNNGRGKTYPLSSPMSQI